MMDEIADLIKRYQAGETGPDFAADALRHAVSFGFACRILDRLLWEREQERGALLETIAEPYLREGIEVETEQ